MKLSITSFLFTVGAAKAAEMCSHGKLYISDADDSNVVVFDIHEGNLKDLTPETTITVPANGPLSLAASGGGEEIGAMYRGDINVGYSDGKVFFIDTGVRKEFHGDHYDFEYANPRLIDNAQFDCARAIHFVPHADLIAIFCDGSLGDTAADQVNTTVWVVDERKFGSTESAIVHNITLDGSHHGAAVPVDDGHLLYSIATDDRVNRVEGAPSVPSQFIVEDYDGNRIHSLDNLEDRDAHCAGYHGEWAHGDEFALACDSSHGGILLVDYSPATADGSPSYSSRALDYPASFTEHRTGRFAGHDKSHVIVGNLGGEDSYHLMAFEHGDEELEEDQMLELDAEQCAFDFEKSEAEMILIMMPTGKLHVYEYDGHDEDHEHRVLDHIEGHEEGWKELASTQVVPDMSACNEIIFKAGFVHAFAIHKESRTVYAVDLHHAHDGELEVTSTTIDFTPFDAVVAGAPEEIVCVPDEHTGDEGADCHCDGPGEIHCTDEADEDKCSCNDDSEVTCEAPSPSDASATSGSSVGPMLSSFAVAFAAIVAVAV